MLVDIEALRKKHDEEIRNAEIANAVAEVLSWHGAPKPFIIHNIPYCGVNGAIKYLMGNREMEWAYGTMRALCDRMIPMEVVRFEKYVPSITYCGYYDSLSDDEKKRVTKHYQILPLRVKIDAAHSTDISTLVDIPEYGKFWLTFECKYHMEFGRYTSRKNRNTLVYTNKGFEISERARAIKDEDGVIYGDVVCWPTYSTDQSPGAWDMVWVPPAEDTVRVLPHDILAMICGF